MGFSGCPTGTETGDHIQFGISCICLYCILTVHFIKYNVSVINQSICLSISMLSEILVICNFLLTDSILLEVILKSKLVNWC